MIINIGMKKIQNINCICEGSSPCQAVPWKYMPEVQKLYKANESLLATKKKLGQAEVLM